jgi:mono/diheme cytochrome c family protein
MRSGIRSAAIALVIITVSAAAYVSTNRAPVVVRAMSIDDDAHGDIVNGRKVFLRANCYTCHGGRAGGAMCPSLRADRPDFDDVEKAVLNGTPSGMPSFRGVVSRQEIADLAAYFQSLRTPAEPTFTHWWEPGVPAQ